MCTHLSWLKNKIRVKELWQEVLQPGGELLLVLDDSDHQVSFLQAWGQEVITTWLIIYWTESKAIVV